MESTNRNLLFGILALQLGFITRKQLIASVRAWIQEKPESLDAVLVAADVLDTDARALLLALVKKHLELHGGNADRSLAALSTIGSLRDELLALGNPDVNATMSFVASDPDSRNAGSLENVFTATADSKRSGGRYRIIRPHAKGGLGEVFVATDAELDREVALKEIQPKYADDVPSRTRFRLEAEVTGKLEHPGIVPVYGLGQYADGRPFYAMRFIRGGSLKEAIESFHDRFPSIAHSINSGEAAVELRKLLRRFIDVCNAIEYAHSRGVLHRDLKPGNIVLGKYGETLVVDWGLAKPLGKTDAPDASLPPLAASSDSSVAPTMLGIAVGTPAYMSPEQAAGRINELGPATDVYSLGATLYHLLVGRPPVIGKNAEELIAAVKAGDIPPTRRVRADVPRALEAICQKALALEVTNRYASPRKLVEDLECWLADEPTAVYAEPLRDRMRRWTRRRPGVTASIASAVLFGLAGFAVVASLLTIKNGELLNLNANLDTAQTIAQEEARVAKRNLYASHLNLIQMKWNANDIQGVEELLSRQVPQGEGEDLRGFEWHYFRKLTRASLASFGGVTEEIASVAASPDGRRFAGAGKSSRIYLWNAANYTLERTLEAHRKGRDLFDSSAALAVTFSKDAELLASSASLTLRQVDNKPLRHGEICVWNAMSGELLCQFEEDAEGVRGIAFASDGRSLITAGAEGMIKRRSIPDGEVLWNLKWPESNQIYDVECSPCGRFFAVSGDVADSDTGKVRVFSQATNEELTTIQGRESAFSRSGNELGSIVWSEEYQAPVIRLWNTADGKLGRTLQGYAEKQIASLAFNPKSDEVAAAVGNVLQVWRADTGILEATWRGHRGQVNCVTFAADGVRLLSSGADGGGKVWRNIPESDITLLENVADPPQFTSFSRGSKRVVGFEATDHSQGATIGERIRVWEVATGREVGSFEPTVSIVNSITPPVETATLSPDGNRLVWASNFLNLHDLRTPKQQPLRIPVDNQILCAAFDPSGDFVAFCDGGEIRVIDAVKGTRRHSFAFVSSVGVRFVHALTFSSDGRFLAAGGSASEQDTKGNWSSPGIVKVWEIGTGKEILVNKRRSWGHLDGDGPSVVGLAFSPDSCELATIDDGLTLAVYNVSTGKEIFSRRGHRLDDQFSFQHAVLCFDPSGKRIATCSNDLRIWDARNGEELLTIPGLSADVIGFDDSGETLILAQSSGIRRIHAPHVSPQSH